MKKVIFILTTLTGFIGHSQDLMDKIAQEACDCMSKKKTENMNSQDVQTEAGGCIMLSFANHVAELTPDQKIKLGNKEAMQELGIVIGTKMAGYCPSFLIQIAKGMKDEEQEEEPPLMKNPPVEISGEITEIRTGEFVSIVVKDQNAKAVTLFLMDYFESAGVFTENKVHKGDKITAQYIEKEMYDPKKKEFRNFKIISDLEKK